MTATTGERQIFISHAGPDRAWAEWIGWTLKEHGFWVVLDLWDWRVGESWGERLRDAARSGVLIVLLSPHYIGSPHAAAGRDVALAADRNVRPALLPVEIEPLPPGDLPAELAGLLRLRVFGLSEEEAAARLVAAVRHALDTAGQGASDPQPTAHRPASSDPAAEAEPVPRLPSATARPDVSNVPAEPPGVPDRESLLQQLRLEMNSSHAACMPPAEGPDGIGASDVAQEYAARFASQYDLVWWVPAGDADQARAAYTELAHRLGLAVGGGPDAAVPALFTHLAHERRWLIVLVSAAAPDELTGLLPPEPGHLLVLSAHPGWLAGVRPYRPSPLPGAEESGFRPPGPSTAVRPPLRVLAVATEWASRLGGISSFNRSLCEALAAAGAEVYCLVPRFDRQEETDAQQRRVTLVEAEDPPVWTGELSLLRRPPELSVVPDVVLGHGRITGPAAQLLREQHYQDAQLVHIIHMLPSEIEFLKEDRADDPSWRADERTQVEVALGRAADHTAVVGPLLHNKFAKWFPSSGPLGTRLLCLNPGFDGPGAEARVVPAGDPAVLVFGRAEDVRLKGLDLAARALGHFVQRTKADRKLDFVIRGLRTGQPSHELIASLDAHAGKGTLNIQPMPYLTDSGVLESDLTSASLVLLPSRSEGFGLSAVEAIAAGTPVLVSDASGLGLLLRETLGAREAADHVVETRDNEEDVERWSLAVEHVLASREKAFGRAARLRDQLRSRYTWRGAAAALLNRLSDPPVVQEPAGVGDG
ncbi:TIR domain-containing protein [Streptomyces sp. NPDC001381]|uniref:TIR domain-containing protein n=1 Tax=Streptomyces sp. NPDC001381 TaxID=3364567 RepID=UPI003696693D